MNRRLRFRSPIAYGLVLALFGMSSGCDSGSSVTGVKAPSQTASQLTGHVLNDDGPISTAKIEAHDATGAVAARTEIKGDSVYALTIPAGTRYPLILTAYPDGENEQPVKAAVTDAAVREQDISAVTTIVVNTALSLGGINETNLAKAAGAAIAQRRKSGGSGGGGQTTESFKGDPTKQYGGWH